MFHLWERLPTELKLAILKAAVLQARPVTHVHHAIALDGDLGALIGTQNKEVVELALAAYHANNTFHLQVERVGFSSILRLMRPQAQYARMIQHLQFSIDLKIPK